MLLTLVRTKESPEETMGVLLIDGHPYCGTLEPPVVPNAQHPKGAIPLGWYKLTLSYSSPYGRILPLFSMSIERRLVCKLMAMQREEFYLEVTNPERFYIEHDRLVCLPNWQGLLR